MEYVYSVFPSKVCCVAQFDGKDVARCIVTVCYNEWTIVSWFVNSDRRHTGLGRQVLTAALTKCKDVYGSPQRILYNWNGDNQYVYDWLVRNFDAVCECPLAIQKYDSSDDWDSHKYVLDLNKFKEYFKL